MSTVHGEPEHPSYQPLGLLRPCGGMVVRGSCHWCQVGRAHCEVELPNGNRVPGAFFLLCLVLCLLAVCRTREEVDLPPPPAIDAVMSRSVCRGSVPTVSRPTYLVIVGHCTSSSFLNYVPCTWNSLVDFTFFCRIFYFSVWVGLMEHVFSSGGTNSKRRGAYIRADMLLTY